MTEVQGEPDSTGKKETFISHEARLQANHASLVLVDHLAGQS
ncbi:MAG TPA: hypothetical protein VF550_08680 [Polyangia bacterium]